MKQVVVWPAYLDASKTRLMGRRVRQDLGVRRPTPEEIAEAAKSIGLQAELQLEAYYPRAFLERGRVLVHWEGKKNALLKRIASRLKTMRQEAEREQRARPR